MTDTEGTATGITRAPLGQQPLSATVRRAEPRVEEWLPEALGQLLPTCVSTVRALRDRYEHLRDYDVRDLLVNGFDADAGYGEWAAALVRWTDRYADVDENPDDLPGYHGDHLEHCRDLLVTPGQEPEGRDRDRLLRSFVATLRRAPQTPVLRVEFDGPEWFEQADERTGRRSLDALEALAEAVDVRLAMSPRVDEYLRQTYPAFHDEYLTERRDTTPHAGSRTVDETDQQAFDVLREWTPQGGRVRVLSSFPASGERTPADVVDDPSVDLARGSVDRYISEMEADGLLEVDRRSRPHRVSLTPLGRVAQGLITPNLRILHPSQKAFDSGLTRNSQSSASTVYRADRDTGVEEEAPAGGGRPAIATAEEYLANTGEPAEHEGYVQWLGEAADETGRLNPYNLHERYLAGRRGEGVTFVDDDVEEFDDGRVAYLSCFEDHVQVMTQWGGSGSTLVRLAALLTSEQMWGRVLTREAIGDDLSKIHEGIIDDALLDTLQRGDQMGWLGKEEASYYDWRDRLHGVGKGLLADWADLDQWNDHGRKSAVYRRAHGLLATMTKLLDALGIDVTFHVRLPDAKNVTRDDGRRRDFLGFLSNTVPKQSAYGVYSGWRELCETREDRLQYRLGAPDVDPENPTADLTASWVVSGRGVEDIVEEAAAHLRSIELREAVEEGREETFAIDIPVYRGGSLGHIKSIVEERLTDKGYLPKAEETRHVTRLLMSALGRSRDRCSPYAVAEALLALGEARMFDPETRDVCAALAALPAERLYPEAPRTVGEMVSALLRSDEPLTPAELKAVTSASSYDRHAPVLEALGIIERTEGQWQAVIDPWWSADSDRPEGEWVIERGSQWTDDLLYEVALAAPGDAHRADLWCRETSLEEIREEVGILEPWVHVVATLLEDDLLDDVDDAGVRDERRVRLGHIPAGAENQQTALV